MSVRPIDMNGMIQSTYSVEHAKVQEDQKPILQQQVVTVEIAQKEDAQSHQVNETAESQKEASMDREGDGKQYAKNPENKKKKKTEVKEDGVVINKSAHSSFDISV